MTPDQDYDGELVEEYLRYLRGKGTRPRMDRLSAEDRDHHEGLFELLDAIVDADTTETPPMEEDPVAIRLGLVRRSAGAPGDIEALQDLPHVPETIALSLREVTQRFQGEVDILTLDPGTAAASYGTNGLRVMAECRSLGELVLVCSSATEDLSEVPRSAVHLFTATQAVNAVAVASTIDNKAVVLTHADCLRAIDPQSGWADPVAPSLPEPLELALGRHFERSLPRWDEIAKLDEMLVLKDTDDEIAGAVREILTKKRTAQIPAKKKALEAIRSLSAEPFEDLLRDVRAGRLNGEDLIERLGRISRQIQ